MSCAESRQRGADVAVKSRHSRQRGKSGPSDTFRALRPAPPTASKLDTHEHGVFKRSAHPDDRAPARPQKPAPPLPPRPPSGAPFPQATRLVDSGLPSERTTRSHTQRARTNLAFPTTSFSATSLSP